MKLVELPVEGFELYVYGDYSVRLIKLKDPVLDEKIFMYGIFNRATGVCEAECRRSWTAKLIAQKFDSDDKPQEAPNPTPAPAVDVRGMH